MTNHRIRLLVVEDSEDDARLLYSELTRTYSDITYARVDCDEDMRTALLEPEWDIVVSDHSMPRFSSLEALELLKECGKDIPFIIYSGEVSEHVEVAAMCSGAQDSIVKGNFARLLPAMERELSGAATRRAKEQADARVHKLAFYDSLTGLPNRNLFCDHVGRKLSQAKGQPAAIYILDIDRFLRVNNCFGHNVGDALIRQIAQRLQECVPEDGMVARTGGDEFAVFLGNTSCEQQGCEAAEQIRRAFSKPFIEGALEFYISASIGIVASPQDGGDVSELLINAETAMFRAKSLGGNTYEFYAREMGVVAGAQLVLESALRKTVERQELLLEYQPSMNVMTGALQQVARILAMTEQGIQVEGYTDDAPISTSQFPSNWELSAARASSVVGLFVDSGVAEQRLSVVGFGPNRPLMSNDTSEGRAQNRRVTVMILAETPGKVIDIPLDGAAPAQ